MKIKKIEVKNFRLLRNITIELDDEVTLIVGRNNTGKTSLTELFYKFFGIENTQFKFEDFSIETCSKIKTKDIPNFNCALNLYKDYITAVKDNEAEETIFSKQKMFRNEIPTLEANVFIEYEENDDLASLSRFIMDLDPTRKDAMISCQYIAIEPEQIFMDFLQSKANNDIIKFLRKKYKKYYRDRIYAVDALNPKNRRLIDKKSIIEDVFIARFIYAQRNLDDVGIDNKKRLSRSFEDYYKFNTKNNDDTDEFETVLNDACVSLDEKYQNLFNAIFKELEIFGINTGVNLQKLQIKSFFEAEKILKGNTRVFYAHDEYNFLPESYNGLGYSNLIYIILEFISFYEEFDKRKPRPDFQLLFVEEPEAHLHPQMQYVFIKNIRDFIKSKNSWQVQVIITTHSPHLVSESISQNIFDSIRYFDRSTDSLTVKNLSEFQNIQKKNEDNPIEFLKQYMSLNRCDMFFADKIIMVEGTVERLLLPLIIRKVAKSLSSQYISIIEIGGAYAHKFKEILNFLNVKTLIITDIDSVDVDDNRKKCKVTPDVKTSNYTLINWIPKLEDIQELLTATEDKKIEKNVRVTYQKVDSNLQNCGRSFEEAFILKNAKLFASNKEKISTQKIFQKKSEKNKFENMTEEEIVQKSYEISSEISKKTDFAFDIMVLGDWEVPIYIEEGLKWLAK